MSSAIEGIISTVRNYPGVTRKRPIERVISSLPPVNNAYFDMKMLTGSGDDSAAFVVDVEGEDGPVFLLAADGIMQSLIDKDPYWAGYSSVLVNVNDIAAMGGLPLAMVNILCTRNDQVLDEVLRGISEGCSKFGVSMVGGHTHPDGNADSISVSILGIVKRDCIITSYGAQEGDSLILAFDTDGRVTPGIPYSWDTTSHKTPDAVQAQIKAVNVLAEMKMITSGKDLSNPGMLGTVGMLMETSGKGCVIDLDKIPIPDSLEFSHWLTVYQGCGFVFTCSEENQGVVRKVLEEAGLTVCDAGKVDDGNKVVLKQQDEQAVLFDFSKDAITGAKPKDIKS